MCLCVCASWQYLTHNDAVYCAYESGEDGLTVSVCICLSLSVCLRLSVCLSIMSLCVVCVC